MNWTLTKKMIMGFAVFIILALIFSIYTINEVNSSKKELEKFQQHQKQVTAAQDFRIHTANLWQFLTDASLTKDRKVIDTEAKNNLDEAHQDISELIKLDNTPENVKRLEDIKSRMNSLWTTGNNMFEGYLISAEKGSSIMKEFDGVSSKLLADVGAIVKEIDQENIAVYQGILNKKEAQSRTTKIIIAVFLACIVGLSYFLIRDFRNIVEGLRGGINTIAASSSQILTATAQLAAGSVETATAVSQTVTSVEEVKQTSHLSSQKSKSVSEIAQKTVGFSNEGKKSVEEIISGMNLIKEQSRQTTESIVRLSDQSRAIGEIIVAVNGIADQSNLLAVNAAIEAAKAGEQGKGFAVVAQEIKYLADQSKQSTVQVRTILDDIQKAVTSVATVTERGTRAVDEGAKQSAKTEEVILNLSESIKESAQAAIQIAASAQQQLAGMDQIASAMENIKIAAEQSAASTKQVETAARSLHDLGENLKQMSKQI